MEVLKMALLMLTSKTSALFSLSSSSLNFPQTISKISSVRIPPILITNSSLMDSVKKVSYQNSAAQNCEVLREFMMDMKSEGCVNSVTLDGVKNVDVDLSNQVVKVLGNSPAKILSEALEEQTGRKAQLVGQDFVVSTAVAEFKGPRIFGVVRLSLVNMESTRIEANFSGLPPVKLGWSINEFGDLTRGACSTGKVFNPMSNEKEEVVGDLGILDVDNKGNAFFSGVKEKLRVGDLIGRSIAVYGTVDKSDEGLTAAVIAISAGVDDNCKRLCSCDGTPIWEANNSNIVCTKV